MRYIVEEVLHQSREAMFVSDSLMTARAHAERLARTMGGEFAVRDDMGRLWGTAVGSGGLMHWKAT